MRVSHTALSVLLLALGACASGGARHDAGIAGRTAVDARVSAPADSGVTSPRDTRVSMSADSGGMMPLDAKDGAVDVELPGCQGTQPLRCGERWTHDTTVEGQADMLHTYACTARALTGREVVYTFRTREACRVSVQLGALQTDLDLFELDTCEAQSCKQASSTPLDLQQGERLVFDAAASSSRVLVVDGYARSAGSYNLEVDCLCGAASASFTDGRWRLEVDRRWHGDPARVSSPSAELVERDYAAVTDAKPHDLVVSNALRQVSIGTIPWLGAITQGTPGSLRYELTSGAFAGGRWIVWNAASGLEAELTLYGSGVPIVSSERGRLVRVP